MTQFILIKNEIINILINSLFDSYYIITKYRLYTFYLLKYMEN